MNYVRAFWNAVREGGVARKLAPGSGGRGGKVAKWPLVLAGGVAGLAGRRRGGGSVDGDRGRKCLLSKRLEIAIH